MNRDFVFICDTVWLVYIPKWFTLHPSDFRSSWEGDNPRCCIHWALDFDWLVATINSHPPSSLSSYLKTIWNLSLQRAQCLLIIFYVPFRMTCFCQHRMFSLWWACSLFVTTYLAMRASAQLSHHSYGTVKNNISSQNKLKLSKNQAFPSNNHFIQDDVNIHKQYPCFRNVFKGNKLEFIASLEPTCYLSVQSSETQDAVFYDATNVSLFAHWYDNDLSNFSSIRSPFRLSFPFKYLRMGKKVCTKTVTSHWIFAFAVNPVEWSWSLT